MLAPLRSHRGPLAVAALCLAGATGCGATTKTGDATTSSDAATTPGPPSNGCVAIEGLTIDCLLFYRASVEASPNGDPPLSTEQHVLLSKGDTGDGVAAGPDTAIGEFVFRASYWDNPYEGASLSLSVAAKDAPEKSIFSQLFQFNRSLGVCDQFVGDHGFTGLLYVHHPTTTAELQIICSAR